MSGAGPVRGAPGPGRPQRPPPPSPSFRRARDPIFALAEPLRPGEEDTHSRKPVAPPREREEPREQEQPRERAEAAGGLPGGWLGRGCAKGGRRRKSR